MGNVAECIKAFLLPIHITIMICYVGGLLFSVLVSTVFCQTPAVPEQLLQAIDATNPLLDVNGPPSLIFSPKIKLQMSQLFPYNDTRAKFEKQRATVMQEVFPDYQAVKKSVLETRSKNSVVIQDGKVVAVGRTELTKILWPYKRHSRFVYKDEKLNRFQNGFLNEHKFVVIQNGVTSNWISRRYWFEIKGVFRIVLAEFYNTKTLYETNRALFNELMSGWN